MSQKCCKLVSHGWRYFGCSRNGSIEHDGKFYCKQHDPVEVAKRSEARSERWAAERTSLNAKFDRDHAASQAYRLLETKFPDDPLGNLERLLASESTEAQS